MMTHTYGFSIVQSTLRLSLDKVCGHKGKAGSDQIENGGGGHKIARGGRSLSSFLCQRQNTRPGGGDVGGGDVVALLGGEAGLQPAVVDVGVGEAQVVLGVLRLTHHQHLQMQLSQNRRNIVCIKLNLLNSLQV